MKIVVPPLELRVPVETGSNPMGIALSGRTSLSLRDVSVMHIASNSVFFFMRYEFIYVISMAKEAVYIAMQNVEGS